MIASAWCCAVDFLFAVTAVNTSANMTSFTSLLASVLSNPTAAIAVAIQFLLGLAAGYYTAKVARYIIALVGVFVLGALIGAWGTAGSVESAVKELSKNWETAKDLAMQLARLFATILVGPTALGFFVGIVVGLTRK